MSNKLRILGSRRGVDVKNALPQELNYDSDKNTWKYQKRYQGNLKITIPGGGFYEIGSVKIEHNLGYKPQLLGTFISDIDPDTPAVGRTVKIPGTFGFSAVYDYIESAYVPGDNESWIYFQFIQGWVSSNTEANIEYDVYILIEPEIDPWYE